VVFKIIVSGNVTSCSLIGR